MPDLPAITFDVGGTLIEPWPSVGHLYAEVAARHGSGRWSPDDLNRRFVSAWTRSGGRAESKDDWRTVVGLTFEERPTSADLDTLFEALYARFMEPDAWHVFDDVRPALESLRQAGYRLGIVSNWDDRLRPLLGRLDLTPFFEVIVISCEAGCRKPGRAIFEQAAKALDLPPHRIVHVGDHPQHDVEGAMRAGLRAIGLHRGHPPPQPGWITSLDTLPKRLS